MLTSNSFDDVTTPETEMRFAYPQKGIQKRNRRFLDNQKQHRSNNNSHRRNQLLLKARRQDSYILESIEAEATEDTMATLEYGYYRAYKREEKINRKIGKGKRISPQINAALQLAERRKRLKTSIAA